MNIARFSLHTAAYRTTAFRSSFPLMREVHNGVKDWMFEIRRTLRFSFNLSIEQAPFSRATLYNSDT